MEAVKVCRICLAVDVKMFDLQEQPLEIYFEQIIGAHNMSMMELPPFACFECAALVKKYYNFRERCLRAESILYNILYANGKITKEDIQKINRFDLKLPSNYTIHKTSQDNVIYHYGGDKFETSGDPEYLEDSEVKMEAMEERQACFADFLSPLFLDNKQLGLVKDETASIKKEIGEKHMKLRDKKTELLESIEHKGASSIITLQSEKLTYFLEPVAGKMTINPAELIELAKSEGDDELTISSISNDTTVSTRRRSYKNNESFEDIPVEDYTTVIRLTMNQQIKEFNKRKLSPNYINGTYKCDLCYKGFSNHYAWVYHVRRHNPSSGDVECPICKIRCQGHLSANHALMHELRYKCQSCPHVSQYLEQARRHEKWHRGFTYTCEFCGEVSRRWYTHVNHIRMKHPSVFICDVCGKSFYRIGDLKRHKTVSHGNEGDSVASDEGSGAGLHCDLCNNEFSSTEAYDTHMDFCHM